MNALDAHNKKNSLVLSKLNLDIINDMISERTGTRISLNTKSAYLKVGNDYNKYLEKRGQDVSVESVHSFLQSLDLAPASKNIKFFALKTIIAEQPEFKRLNLGEWIKKELRKAYRSNKREYAVRSDEYLKLEQIEKLKSAAKLETALIIEAFFQTGCRITELINIKKKDIKINNAVKIKVTGKGN